MVRIYRKYIFYKRYKTIPYYLVKFLLTSSIDLKQIMKY